MAQESISKFLGFICFADSLYLYHKSRSHHPEFKGQVTPNFHEYLGRGEAETYLSYHYYSPELISKSFVHGHY